MTVPSPETPPESTPVAWGDTVLAASAVIAGVALGRSGKIGLAAGVAAVAGLKMMTNKRHGLEEAENGAEPLRLPLPLANTIPSAEAFKGPAAGLPMAVAVSESGTAPEKAASLDWPSAFLMDLTEGTLHDEGSYEPEGFLLDLMEEQDPASNVAAGLGAVAPCEAAIWNDDQIHHKASAWDMAAEDVFAFPLGPLIWEQGTEVYSESHSLGHTVWYQAPDAPAAQDWTVQAREPSFDDPELVPAAEVQGSDAIIAHAAMPSHEEIEARSEPAVLMPASADVEVDELPDLVFEEGLKTPASAMGAVPGTALPEQPEVTKEAPVAAAPAENAKAIEDLGEVQDDENLILSPPFFTAKPGAAEILVRENPFITVSPSFSRPGTPIARVPVGDGTGLHGLSPQMSEAVLFSRGLPGQSMRIPTYGKMTPASIHRSMAPMAPMARSRRRGPARAVLSVLAVLMTLFLIAAGLWRDGEIYRRMREMGWEKLLPHAEPGAQKEITVPAPPTRERITSFVLDRTVVR